MIQHGELDQLYRALLAASRAAFNTVQEQHLDEIFYGFGLYHEPLWGYIVPTCNTEEGLTRRAQEYQMGKYGPDYALKSMVQLRTTLRWNPAGWAYHLAGNVTFSEVEQWLCHYQPQQLLLDKYEINSEEWDHLHSEMEAICRGVLRELDAEKLFERTATRERIVLNIMMGDQDDSWIAHAKTLNSPEVFRRWQQETGEHYEDLR